MVSLGEIERGENLRNGVDGDFVCDIEFGNAEDDDGQDDCALYNKGEYLF